MVCVHVCGESVNSGLDYWTDSLMIRIIELSVFLISAASTAATNYNNTYMEHCNCANFKVAGLRKAKWLYIVCHLCTY